MVAQQVNVRMCNEEKSEPISICLSASYANENPHVFINMKWGICFGSGISLKNFENICFNEMLYHIHRVYMIV